MPKGSLKTKHGKGITPSTAMPSLFEEMEQFGSIWDWFLNHRNLPGQFGQFMSGQTGLTVSEDQKYFYVTCKMPGLDIGDIEVSCDNGTLNVHGESFEEECEGRRYFCKESNNYNYRLSLPNYVDWNKSSATYKNGILHITFNKMKGSQGSSIEVRKG